ncbi:M28 family peptidase, partial [Nonomuraea sp. NPDC049709]|uniref:M28 family metallopeptidase n=1 Tax=Nonomuraea sp. NPDC049709 TaxID=3154736 RepID=UPI003414306C
GADQHPGAGDHRCGGMLRMTSTDPAPAHTAPVPAAALEQLSTGRMLATVRELAGDRYSGRRVGTPGGRAAATWLAGELRELGAEVELTGFPVSGVRELYGTPIMRWNIDGKPHPLEHRRDFAEHLASAELPVARTGPVAAAGHADLHGRWVLAADDLPQACERAAARQAAGVITARGTDADGWLPKMIAGPPVQPMPILALRTELHQHLTEALGRGPVHVTASMPMRVVVADGVNVEGRLPAARPRADTGAALTRVLLTAHFDGVGDDPERRLPAAADNASGVAVILEVARVLVAVGIPDPLEVRVALLDGEEAGAWGSAHHAATLPADTLVINLDGAAQLHQAASVEAGGPAHALLACLDRAARLTGVPLRAGAMASDNRRYAAAGLAAIGIGMGMPGYQTPAETPDRVEAGTLMTAARLLLATVSRLAHPGTQDGPAV